MSLEEKIENLIREKKWFLSEPDWVVYNSRSMDFFKFVLGYFYERYFELNPIFMANFEKTLSTIKREKKILLTFILVHFLAGFYLLCIVHLLLLNHWPHINWLGLHPTDNAYRCVISEILHKREFFSLFYHDLLWFTINDSWNSQVFNQN